jgi:hypothetical protein
MSTPCHPLPQPVADEMLQIAARAICDRPGDSPAQRDSRTRQMVHATMGFEPRDGLEYMLTAMVVGHFNLLLDSMFDVFQGQTDPMKARTKTTIVALDRTMLGFVKEMAVSRRRPVVRWAEKAAQDDALASAAMVGEAPVETPVKAPVEAPVEAKVGTEPVVAGEETEIAVARAEVAVAGPPIMAAAGAVRRVADIAVADSAKPVVAQAVKVVPARADGGVVSPMEDPQRAVAAKVADTVVGGPDQPMPRAAAAKSANGVGGGPANGAARSVGDATLEQHVAEFQEAFVAMAATLAEARALDEAFVAAEAASGD